MTVSVLLVVDDRPDNLLVLDQSRVRLLLLQMGTLVPVRPLSRALAWPGPSSARQTSRRREVLSHDPFHPEVHPWSVGIHFSDQF